jgi:hypothetical protein
VAFADCVTVAPEAFHLNDDGIVAFVDRSGSRANGSSPPATRARWTPCSCGTPPAANWCPDTARGGEHVPRSLHSGGQLTALDWAVDRAIELAAAHGVNGRITGSHVYAARLHDIRFRQLETGLPAKFQTPDEIKRQRKVHDKLIEKGLQLISDSFLDQVETRCAARGVPLRRQLLEGINYEELVKEVNRGAGQLPSLIGFDPNIAAHYDGGEKVRSDVRLGEDGRIVGEDEAQADKVAGSFGTGWGSVSEFTYHDGLKRLVRTVLPAEAAKNDRLTGWPRDNQGSSS